MHYSFLVLMVNGFGRIPPACPERDNRMIG
jgi:hypothetical protein